MFNLLTTSLLVLEIIIGIFLAYVLRKVSRQDDAIHGQEEARQDLREYLDARLSSFNDACKRRTGNIQDNLNLTAELSKSDHDMLVTMDEKISGMEDTIESLEDEMKTYYKRKNGDN